MTETTESKRGRGRPRKNEKKDGAACVREYRYRMNKEKTRLDIYIGLSATNRITTLAKHWNYTIPQAIERLILESELKYKDVFHPFDEEFPEGISDEIVQDIINDRLQEMLSMKGSLKKNICTGNKK